ncbi:beta-1,4-galactosyltransferase galt-1-like [Spea bombifrons]|uniref:beta-1,4-galactosyltransferase galt-1-like n=1 Tax=Spea bombifrons TaxID=233779 RepID=UPI00234BF8A2|nr:beta-1,4-galactosyltransferase galt-1-like [Spea bombifrons]
MRAFISLKNVCKVLSLLFSTITVLYMIYIVVLVKTVLPGGTFMLPFLQPKELEEGPCEGTRSSETIVKVKDSQTYLVAAYLDLRGSSVVRIIGITYRYERDLLYCDFCFNKTNGTALADLQIHSDHFEFPYGTADLLCDLKGDRIPQYVSIHREGEPQATVLQIRNIDAPVEFEYDFLMCISAMFGSYNNVLQFIQSMEMYQILGVQKVIIYHTDSSPLIRRVMAHYMKEEFLELISWPITSFLNVSSGWHYPEHPGELHYYGQTAALNDCLYRHMYRSRYISLNDIDELILPAIHKDWREMMDFLQQPNPSVSVFEFENHVFPTALQDKKNPSTPEEWNSVPGLNILKHVYREPNVPDEINPTKMIVNPRDVVRTSVHVPLDFYGEKYQVPSDFARLCHYRQPKQKDLGEDMLIKDDIMAKYENVLVERVNGVLQKVGLLKTIPKNRRQ